MMPARAFLKVLSAELVKGRRNFWTPYQTRLHDIYRVLTHKRSLAKIVRVTQIFPFEVKILNFFIEFVITKAPLAFACLMPVILVSFLSFFHTNILVQQ